jgi:hypothetical protein
MTIDAIHGRVLNANYEVTSFHTAIIEFGQMATCGCLDCNVTSWRSLTPGQRLLTTCLGSTYSSRAPATEVSARPISYPVRGSRRSAIRGGKTEHPTAPGPEWDRSSSARSPCESRVARR